MARTIMEASILIFMAAAYVFILLRQWLINRKPTLTGEATVISRRAELARQPTRGQGYNYLVTFRLADGEEIELYTAESEYKQLKEGLTGQLTWHTQNFCDFTT